MDVPGQLNLFNEAELEQNPTIAEPEALESLLPEKETKKRKSRATNAERFKGIPVVKNIWIFRMQKKSALFATLLW